MTLSAQSPTTAGIDAGVFRLAPEIRAEVAEALARGSRRWCGRPK